MDRPRRRGDALGSPKPRAKAAASYARHGFGSGLDAIPPAHRRFLREQTLDYWETDDALYVHATVDPDLELSEQPPFLLFWQPFQNPTRHRSGKTIICGHVPQRSGLPVVFDRGLCLDTAACAGGWLTGYDRGNQRFVQANEQGQCRTFTLDSLPEENRPR